MRFSVIQGGRGSEAQDHTTEGQGNSLPTAQDVRGEAERRLRQAGWDRWQARSAATGCAMPRDLHYMAIQIGYVAEALSRLATIPDDFRSDSYWPRFTS